MFGNLSFLKLSVGMDLILINITRFVCVLRDWLYADDLFFFPCLAQLGLAEEFFTMEVSAMEFL